MNYSTKIANALKKYDFSFFGTLSIIFFIGIINLYSATHASNDSSTSNLYKVQIIWFFLSLLIGIGISFIRPKNFFRFSYLAYFISIIMLLAVLLMGHKGMGARRWLGLGPIRFQPSEMTKIAIVLVLSRWFVRNNSENELGLGDMVIPFFLTCIPVFLIVIQPDLGTGLLLLLIFSVIAFYKKLKWKSIAIVVILAMLSGTAVYKFGLKEYQRQRILTFIDPTADARGSGYNAIQSKIAIGSGQFWGKGFKKSSQASLNYLPENHTDFIFSIYNEEHGFAGSLFLILCYVVLLLRFIWLAVSVTNLYNSILVIGFMSIFFWHTFINMSMVMGLLPIVGLPLPLMSYGGSSLLTFFICCGMATSISNSRNLF